MIFIPPKTFDIYPYMFELRKQEYQTQQNSIWHSRATKVQDIWHDSAVNLEDWVNHEYLLELIMTVPVLSPFVQNDLIQEHIKQTFQIPGASHVLRMELCTKINHSHLNQN